jgi:hypothetical protein
VGARYFALYYYLFALVIMRFNLRTPGAIRRGEGRGGADASGRCGGRLRRGAGRRGEPARGGGVHDAVAARGRRSRARRTAMP